MTPWSEMTSLDLLPVVRGVGRNGAGLAAEPWWGVVERELATDELRSQVKQVLGDRA